MVVDVVGVVLVGEPRVRVRGVDGEIAALPQPPDDVAVPGPVAVVDLDHPVLVADRQDQVAVRGRQGHGVHVQPVDRRQDGDDGRRFRGTRLRDLAQDRPAVDVQVVEGVPGPLHLEVRVEHQDHLADVIGGGAVDVDGALGIREHDRASRRAAAGRRGGSRRSARAPGPRAGRSPPRGWSPARGCRPGRSPAGRSARSGTGVYWSTPLSSTVPPGNEALAHVGEGQARLRRGRSTTPPAPTGRSPRAGGTLLGWPWTS